jgi:predicted naringenin-chalcone synthase
MLIESVGGEAESELSTHNGAGANGAARPVSASDRAANGAAGDVGASAGPCVLASKVHQIPGTLDAVTIELAAADGHLQMIKELPDVAGAHLAELVNSFLAGEGLTPEAIDHWLVHPGGRRILESAQSALELSDEQMRVSFDVLAKYGNVGTPSIFYVVHETIERRRPAPGEQGLMVTIGPGVTVGLMLLRW